MLDVKKLLTKILTWIDTKDYQGVWGNRTNITSYNSASNCYTVPSDGFITLEGNYRSGVYVMLMRSDGVALLETSAPSNANAAGNTIVSMHVVKGMRVYTTRSGSYGASYFTPYTT